VEEKLRQKTRTDTYRPERQPQPPLNTPLQATEMSDVDW